MAPKDIRSFFKPAPKPAHGNSLQTNSTTLRDWPTPRLESRHRNVSTEAPTNPQAIVITSSSPASGPASRPAETSFCSVVSNGSRKSVQDGEPIVLDSDSDSDLELLEELDFGLSKKEPQKDPKKKEQEESLAARKSREVPGPRSYIRSKDDGLRKPPKSVPTSNNGAFRNLVQSLQKDNEVELKLAEWKALLEEKLEEESDSSDKAASTIDESLLAGVVNDDAGEEKAKRLYLAMQRTNALESDCVFHFFGDAPKCGSTRRTTFPSHILPRQGWTSCFDDEWSRDQSFLSGFAQQIFEYQSLPEELAQWVIDQVCFGQNTGLTPKYIQLLEAHSNHLEILLDSTTLDDLFAGLGANTQHLGHDIRPSFERSQTSKRPVPPNLPTVLQLLVAAAKWLGPQSRRRALLLLLHTCLDDSVASNAAVLLSVQNAMELLMRYVPDGDPMLNDIIESLLAHISHPILQHTLIASLPTRSPMTAAFRRHLALSFVFYPTRIAISLSDTDFCSLLHDHLETSQTYNINKKTHYASLAASLSLLDTGIGPGPMTVPCQPPPIDGEPPPTLLNAEEIAFNKQIDGLVQHIKLISNRIVEAGAIADLTRLEAKDCAERLCHRLESAVRIGGRRKRGIFDDEDAAVTASKKLFGRWIGKGKGKKTDSDAESGSVTPATADGDEVMHT